MTQPSSSPTKPSLKPCPFCGANEAAAVFKDDAGYQVICVFHPLHPSCGCASGYQTTEELAIRAWNIRTEPVNARMREALEFYANHIHWMSLGEDGPRLLLVAQGNTKSFEGWAMAERALAAPPP